MIDLDNGAGGAERGLREKLFHGEDRTAGDVVLVELRHGLELGLGECPALDFGKHLHEPRQPRLGRGVVGIGDPGLLADRLADFLPHRRLGDEVEIRVGILLPALALQDPPRLAAAGGIARARHRGAELAVRVLRVFLHDPGAGEPLLIAELHAAEVKHAVLHRGEDFLAATRALALIERGDDAERQVQPCAAVADLRGRDQRRAVVEAGGGR